MNAEPEDPAGSESGYQKPKIADYGSLEELTEATQWVGSHTDIPKATAALVFS